MTKLVICSLFYGQALHKHEAIQEVQAVGVPSERLGEEVCVCIRLKAGAKKPTDEEIKKFTQVILIFC